MNEELQKKLGESAFNIIESIEKGVNWASGQAPIVIQELLRVYLFDAWTGFILSLTISIIFMATSIMFYKFVIKKHKVDSIFDDAFFAYFINWVFVFISLAIFFTHVPQYAKKIYKGYNAPRVVVIEQLKEIF